MASTGAGTEPEPLELEVAVRAWTRADYLQHIPARPPRAYRDLGPSDWSLTFDTETTTDFSQRLRVGAYEIRRREKLVESGLFYDPEALHEGELSLITSYACENGLRLLHMTDFVEKVFFRIVSDRRGTLIGANLPFDLTRLAIDHGPAKRNRAMRGGFSLVLTPDNRRPHIQLKRVGARATLIRLTVPDGRAPEHRNRDDGGDLAPHRGYFVDVLGLGAALLGKAYSLAGLTAVLDTATRKTEADQHGATLTPGYLDYLRTDLDTTWECFIALRQRYLTLNLSKSPVHLIHSEASIGKAHLKQLNLKPWRQCQPDVPDWLLATIMESYYGGRCECKIRRIPVPGLYCDFLAQYPTVFLLMGLWPFLIGQGIDWQETDPGAVQALLDQVIVDDALAPDLWSQLHVLCQVELDRDRLPTRARYNGRTYNVALADRTDRLRQWYTLADCIGSKLETGKAPRIVRALHFTPHAPQKGLQSIMLPGNPPLEFDPYRDDLVRVLVEQRARIKGDRDAAIAAGDLAVAARLDAAQLGLKIAVNAIAYGIPIELNPVEHKRPVSLTVYRPNGSSFPTRSRRVEEPGAWFHPLLATLVSAGGRLLLAAAMKLVHDAHGSYAFCDTDSLFITATETGGTLELARSNRRRGHSRGIPALSCRQVETISEQFEALNPYDPELVPGTIFELEPENRDSDGHLREINCLSLAAKRYALFTQDKTGRPAIIGEPGKRKRSEHGLGHLVPPRDLTAELFYDRWWQYLLCRELGLEEPAPSWLEDIAAGKLAITSPHAENAFQLFNRRRPYLARVRPWNFCSLVHVTRIGRALTGIRCLVAPFEPDGSKLTNSACFDRARPSHQPYTIDTRVLVGASDEQLPVQTYGDYFREYERHLEAKGLGPGGGRCRSWTLGFLRAPQVSATRLILIGKEANPLADFSDLILSQRAVEYQELRCRRCDRELSRRQHLWCSEKCRKRAGRQRKKGFRDF